MYNNTQINDNADGSVHAAATQDMEEAMITDSHQPETPETESLASWLALYLDKYLVGGLDASLIPLLDQLDEAEKAYRIRRGLGDSVDNQLDAAIEMPVPVYEVIEIPLTLGSKPACPVCWFLSQREAEECAKQITRACLWTRIYVVRRVDIRTVFSPYAGPESEPLVDGSE